MLDSCFSAITAWSVPSPQAAETPFCNEKQTSNPASSDSIPLVDKPVGDERNPPIRPAISGDTTSLFNVDLADENRPASSISIDSTTAYCFEDQNGSETLKTGAINVLTDVYHRRLTKAGLRRGEAIGNHIAQHTSTNLMNTTLIQSLLLTLTATTLSAATSGDFSYELINSDTEVKITGYLGSDNSVVVPSLIVELPVTTLSDYCFDGLEAESITLPSSLTTIGVEAFIDSTITSLTLPNGVTTIQEGVFANSTITNLTLPNSLITIESEAFIESKITSLTLPNGLATIGTEAFIESAITSITLPNSVTALGEGVFDGCPDLRSAILSNGLDTIPKGTFGLCPSLESVIIPDSILSIEELAFDRCSNLTTITLPNALTHIGDHAFFQSNISEITIPASVNSIGSAFVQCENLANITVDSQNQNYTSIGGVLFDSAITSLLQFPVGSTTSHYTIPETVTTIAPDAFSYSKSIVSISCPKTMTSIGNNAFRRCSNLEAIQLPETLTELGTGILAVCSSLRHADLPTGITEVPLGTFGSCTALTHVTIPEGVTTIQQSAFSSCINLQRIVFPTTLSTLADSSFNNTDELVPIFLGDAPSAASHTFPSTPASLTMYYLSSASGFGSTLAGKPTQVLDANLYNQASGWLLQHSLNYDANLTQDLNQDGVPLLLAYALELDPNQDLSSAMPSISLAGSIASLDFYANQTGMIYTVYASEDLDDWESITVNYTELDASGIQTAWVNSDPYSKLFLKLEVSE